MNETMDRLSVREIRVLAQLRAGGPMSLSDLSRILVIPPSSLYGILTKLQALGLVARNEAKQYAITDEGKKAIEAVKAMLVVDG